MRLVTLAMPVSFGIALTAFSMRRSISRPDSWRIPCSVDPTSEPTTAIAYNSSVFICTRFFVPSSKRTFVSFVILLYITLSCATVAMLIELSCFLTGFGLTSKPALLPC